MSARPIDDPEFYEAERAAEYDAREADFDGFDFPEPATADDVAEFDLMTRQEDEARR